MKNQKPSRKTESANRGSLHAVVGRLTRSAAKRMLGEMGEPVTIGDNTFLCEKRDSTFRTLKGLVRIKAGDVVTHNGNPLLVTEHMEDQHFITFETRQQQPNAGAKASRTNDHE